MHFSDTSSDNGGKYINWFAVCSSFLNKKINTQELMNKSYVEKDTFMFLHCLRSIALLMWMILLVTLTWYMYDIVHILCWLGAFGLQRFKESTWKLCVPIWITLFQSC
jgi:hypothetical protein